jgi:hypothetical protein
MRLHPSSEPPCFPTFPSFPTYLGRHPSIPQTFLSPPSSLARFAPSNPHPSHYFEIPSFLRLSPPSPIPLPLSPCFLPYLSPFSVHPLSHAVSPSLIPLVVPSLTFCSLHSHPLLPRSCIPFLTPPPAPLPPSRSARARAIVLRPAAGGSRRPVFCATKRPEHRATYSLPPILVCIASPLHLHRGLGPPPLLPFQARPPVTAVAYAGPERSVRCYVIGGVRRGVVPARSLARARASSHLLTPRISPLRANVRTAPAWPGIGREETRMAAAVAVAMADRGLRGRVRQRRRKAAAATATAGAA